MSVWPSLTRKTAGRIQKAEAVFFMVITRPPFREAAKNYLAKQNYSEAIEKFEEILKIDSNNLGYITTCQYYVYIYIYTIHN